MRPTQATIHLAHLQHNLQAIRQRVGSRHICLAVKANAYGHGTIAIAQAALEGGVSHLGVAAVAEGVELREAAIQAPILLYSLPVARELPALVEHNLQPFVASAEQCAQIAAVARKQQRVIGAHLKIDTGMGRIGCAPEDAATLASIIAAHEHLHLAGTATHLADALDSDYTAWQLRRFRTALNSIRAVGLSPGIIHAANSGAILAVPDSWFDMVRPGIMAYGYHPDPEQQATVPLRPVMELETQIVFLKRVAAGSSISYGRTWRSRRETTIATLPIGYGDGYSRLLSNRAEVLLHTSAEKGCAESGAIRVPIAGRVCMDQTMIALKMGQQAALFDRVSLFGPDRRGPDAAELARLTDTISYEITCAISARVQRHYPLMQALE